MEVPATVAGNAAKITVALGDKVRDGPGHRRRRSRLGDRRNSAGSADSTAPAAAPTAAPATRRRRTATDVPKRRRSHRRSASRRFEVRIPDIGDAKDVIVVEVKVKAGQDVAVDDLLVVVESDKASMEIPAPVAGRVASVDVDRGRRASTEGSLLAVIEATDRRPMPSRTAADTSRLKLRTELRRRGRRSRPRHRAAAQSRCRRCRRAPQWRVYAGPAVRRLARELGVDLHRSVKGTGPRSRIAEKRRRRVRQSSIWRHRAHAGGAHSARCPPSISHGSGRRRRSS